ncbi:hypothetical protein [Streptomyces sp. yr375]|nr:hypothetical protein [Streptomyces sp. yr375]
MPVAAALRARALIHGDEVVTVLLQAVPAVEVGAPALAWVQVHVQVRFK